jgi:hypothetical protein
MKLERILMLRTDVAYAVYDSKCTRACHAE